MAINTEIDPASALDQFAALILADEALAARIAGAADTDLFIACVIQEAQARSLTLSTRMLRALTQYDPIGLSRWTTRAVQGATWPPRQWLPVQVVMQDGQVAVDWAYFGVAPLTAPFFEDLLRPAIGRPLNRLFRYRTVLDDFLAGAAQADALAPDGFIFHMSRCGSTLVAQMLATLPQTVTISEAAPIDAVVQIGRLWPQVSEGRHVELLRAIIAAFGRRRTGRERHYFIKLDSWHALALPLFRRVFPDVPWVFLYRDPVEVLVSQMRQRGIQMIPEFVPPALYGIDEVGDRNDYCARVLAAICAAAARQAAEDGSGLLVDYRELPEAVGDRVLPHFGIRADASERAAMMAAAAFDAKAPGQVFANDIAAKQQEATPALHAMAERHLGHTHRRLVTLRRENR
jgi:hypothetical protein